jgi:3-ketosteroid 9alpha-monooxygenase subunit A
VWNDPEGNPPPPEAVIPRIEGATSDEWTDWHWYTTLVNSNCREIIDNVVDMAHFFYIHGSLPTYFKNIFEGHVATQYMNSGVRPDAGQPDGPRMLGTTSVASYFGPSFMIDDLTYNYEDGDQKSILINCHYPIDTNSFVLQYGIIVKKSETLPEDAAMQTAIGFGDFVKTGFEQDVQSGRTRRASTIRCCARRTDPSTTFVGGISSSTSMPPTSPRTWSTDSSTNSTPPIRTRRG